MSHMQYKIKCFNCGLHYLVCTWDDQPGEDGEMIALTDKAWPHVHNKGGFCPECGHVGGKKLIWMGAEPTNIFEVIPGVKDEMVSFHHKGGVTPVVTNTLTDEYDVKDVSKEAKDMCDDD